MGLEINFSKELADKAGIEYRLFRNGTLEEVIEAQVNNSDRGYIEYLMTNELCIKVPTTDWHLSISIFDGKITLKPSRSYDILTNWLKSNNIEWAEF